MVIVRCCWKPWWMPSVFAGLAIGQPTGSTSGEPADAAAWIGDTPLTVGPSRISMSILWRGTRDNIYAGDNIEEVNYASEEDHDCSGNLSAQGHAARHKPTDLAASACTREHNPGTITRRVADRD